MGSRVDELDWSDHPQLPPVRVSRRSMAPWYALLALIILSVAAGAWFIITRPQAPPPQLPIEAAPSPSASVPLSDAEQLPADLSPAPNAPPPTIVESVREPSPASAVPNSPAIAPVRAAPEPASSARTRTPRVAEPTLPASEPEPLVYRSQPNSGRIVQLGAFATHEQADEAWRKLTRRYPYLATKPRMVSPVEVRGLGGGRPTRLYRLQLGTASQAQSVVICQQLERARQSCVVVYQ